MIRKVGHIFVIQGGIVKGDAQGVDIVCSAPFSHVSLQIWDANVADTSLESSQEHILENLTFHQKRISASYLPVCSWRTRHIELDGMFQLV